ncbi:hypothetical protein AGRO_4541 [Agrobacterium sp. ATCC 31749]|nr:hypothetical protein AGRO_4541 [Agrobacterium sp. ATCC 31749]
MHIFRAHGSIDILMPSNRDKNGIIARSKNVAYRMNGRNLK